MQGFNTTYTIYNNRRNHRSGHLYQGHYKTILINADCYLLELIRYLVLDPDKELLAARCRREAKDNPNVSLEQLCWAYPSEEKAPFFNYPKVIIMVGWGKIGRVAHDTRGL